MHIHILGIAGTKTAPLAQILKEQGNLVTGSDQTKIFPPVSTILENAHISINQTPITPDIDLAIIGNSYSSFDNTRQEFDQIKKMNIPYISYTKYLVKYLIKNNSILVAGSYGKTTITGLLSYLFSRLQLDPSYMFGGQPVDDFPSTRFGQSDWSIVEADENHRGLDTQTTFLYYPVKYLILTSAQWEHKDSFATAADNLNAYRQLIQKVPKDGLIIFNGQDPDIQKIISSSQAKTIDYQNHPVFKTKLIGQHNQQNISAVFTLCCELGFDQSAVLKIISSFSGIKRRLELIGQKNNIFIYDDFAQSAIRVKSALEALKYSYPQHRLFIYLDPHASFLQNPQSIEEFKTISGLFTDFVLGRISFSAGISKESRVTARNWQNIIGQNFHYLPLDQDIIDYYSVNLQPGDLLIHFSSGGLDGLTNLKKVYNHIKL
jgi:UDP-N-acetylmuramate: L-alanyl-gamma-D-glutamyl-meso-diaminopimelate ligase